MSNHNQNKDVLANLDDMTTLSACTTSLVKRGYEENFSVDNEGLKAQSTEQHYKPSQTHIDNFYRFEGASDPSDNAVLYAIHTDDGKKGMLIDAYGAESSQETDEFIKQVKDIEKTRSEK